MKKLVILIILVLLILSTGCNSEKRPPKFPEIYTGTEGVAIEFPQSTPPKKVYEEQQFAVVVNLHNKGAYSLNKTNSDEYGIVSLDYDPLYFTEIILPSNYFALYGKSLDYPKGESAIQQVSNLKVNKIPGTRVAPKTTIVASVCYPYETILSQPICIDQDYMKIQDKPVCINTGHYSFSSQGAPIAITDLEVNILPLGNDVVQPVFKIKFRNVGKGLVISKTPYKKVYELCSLLRNDNSPNNFNVLKVKAWLGSEENELFCTPENPTLWNNEVEVSCTSRPINPLTNQNLEQPIGNSNYVSILTIKAEYVYRDYTSREIEINRIGR